MCGKSLYLSQFCCESKMALKNKTLKYLKCLSKKNGHYPKQFVGGIYK